MWLVVLISLIVGCVNGNTPAGPGGRFDECRTQFWISNPGCQDPEPCDEHGNFLPKQCDPTGCWCVDLLGNRKPYTLANYGHDLICSETKCEREVRLSHMPNPPSDSNGPSCNKYGNFESLQCGWVGCFCVDLDGELSRQVEFESDCDPNELKRAEWKFKIQMDFSLIEDKQDEFEIVIREYLKKLTLLTDNMIQYVLLKPGSIIGEIKFVERESEFRDLAAVMGIIMEHVESGYMVFEFDGQLYHVDKDSQIHLSPYHVPFYVSHKVETIILCSVAAGILVFIGVFSGVAIYRKYFRMSAQKKSTYIKKVSISNVTVNPYVKKESEVVVVESPLENGMNKVDLGREPGVTA